MGVTIFFNGTLRDEAAFEAVIAEVVEAANRRGFPCRPITARNHSMFRVVEDEVREVVCDVRGIQVEPHEHSEPLTLLFDEDLHVQHWIKTQFAPTKIHVWVVGLLRQIEPHFESFSVMDEGEYWETGDVERLEQHRGVIADALGMMKEMLPEAEGPMRVRDGEVEEMKEHPEEEN